MGDILWLASYPKSGNTWMRILLSNYLGDSEQPADINAIEGGGISSSRDLFDQSVGVRSASLPDDLVERLRPEVYRVAARSVETTMRVKAHDAYHLVPGGEPLFPADVSRGAVYLVRDPRDVAVSDAHHSGVSVELSVSRLNDHERSLTSKRKRTQLPQRMGSWSDHVSSWTEQRQVPVKVVRYEDLLAEPEAVFGAVLEFIGHAPEPGRLRHAVEASSMPRLQAQEAAGSFRERPRRSTDRFFRRGVAGGWRDDLPAALASSIEQTHHETMRRFGYLEMA